MRRDVDNNIYGNETNYNIIPINSHEEAIPYYKYTNWCIAHPEDALMWENYTYYDRYQVYFCLKDGFEQIPKQPTNRCPLDTYGLSMICVIVNEKGNMAWCTCRWNHENVKRKDPDYIMNEKQLSKVVGVNFYQVFKPKLLRFVEHRQQRLKNGEDPNNVFDYVGKLESDGRMVVAIKEVYGTKYNLLNTRNELVLDEWFDNMNSMDIGNCRQVTLHNNGNSKYNLLNADLKLVSKTWFDRIWPYDQDNCRLVQRGNRFNLLSPDNELMSYYWWDDGGLPDKDGYRKLIFYRKPTKIMKVQDGKLVKCKSQTVETTTKLINLLTENVFTRLKCKLLQL